MSRTDAREASDIDLEHQALDEGPVARAGDNDDFWEWFDAPIEVPDRPRRRATVETVDRVPVSPARRAAVLGAWGAVVIALLAVGILVIPTLFGMKVLSVYTGSMAPAVDAGDAIIVKPVLSADLREGEVVAYRPPDNPQVLITHRITAIRYEPGASGGYGDFVITTKGDNNTSADRPFRAAPNDVFGKVVVTLPEMGHLLNFLAGPRGKLLAVAAFAAFVIAGSVSRRRARQVAEAAEAAPA